MEVQCPFKIPDHYLRPTDFSKLILNGTKSYRNRLALVDANTGWSCMFKEIERFVDLFRIFLQNRNVTSNQRLGLVFMNCPEVVFIQLATGLAGIDLIQLNPLATVDELAHCLTISKCDIVLTQPEYQSKLEQVSLRVPCTKRIIVLPSRSEMLEMKGTLKKVKTPRSNNMIFFSSGTTGPPKAFQILGEMVTITVVQSCAPQYYQSTQNGSNQERVLISLPMTHPYAMLSTYCALLNGHSVYIAPRFMPIDFLAAAEQYKITYMNLVPTLVSFLANDDSVSKYDLSHLHSITCAAAPLAPDIAFKCKQRLRLKDMRQMYGLTEMRHITCMPYGQENFASIGLPLPGVICKFVDPDNQETVKKPFEQGELWVTGPQVGGEYFENEEATKETYTKQGDTIWCKTGDIGYFDSLGYIYLTDRAKDIIKYKGFQVSPSEIEAILRKHPDVADCAVVGKPDEKAGEVPIAFVKRRHGSDLKDGILKDMVKTSLSTYKHLSGGVIFLEELPRSNTGKILKRQLRELIPRGSTISKL